MNDDEWVLRYEGFDPKNEGLREALCTLGNGFFATRGAAEEASAGPIHYPGTYIAGGYNRLESEIAGERIVSEDLVNFANWLPLSFRPADGEWLDLESVEILSYRQELHLREGVLRKSYRVRDRTGRVSAIASRRLVHMWKPHYAAIEYTLTPENWSGPAVVRSALDGSVTNSGVARYRQLNSKHLRPVKKGAVAPEGIFLLVQTSQSRLEAAEAARTRLFRAGERIEPESRVIEEDASIAQEFTAEVRAGEPLTVEKIVTLYTSRDRGITEAALDARLALTRCGSFAELLETHRLAWKALWRRCDVEIVTEGGGAGERREQLILRLHIFHLLQTVSLNTVGVDVSVPARGLHGEAYRGHIFWDELFIFPFYTLRLPDVTRSLLIYRYRRLDAARALAKESGYRGAMYPWQSSSDGREESQRIHLNPRSGRWDPDHSRLQRHINAAIAYNIWHYYQITGDRAFIERYGAEMLLEIARFWASIATYNEASERFEINGVMGPDEYHEKLPGATEGGLRNNAYTNVMAVWCVERALEALEIVNERRREELIEILAIGEDEFARWWDMTHRMTVPFHGDGIISQFEGYENLEEIDWEGLRKKYGDIARLDRVLKAEGDTPDRYKVSKQADVIMLFYLHTPKELRTLFRQLGYPFEDDTIRKNLDYYMRRTSHGSTLSNVVYASVLDRLDRAKGFELFCEALRSDIDDIQGGTTPEGIHLAAMAGTVDIVLRHYAGIDTTREAIGFYPRLPRQVKGIRFNLRYQMDWLEVHLAQGRLQVSVDRRTADLVPVLIDGVLHRLRPGETRAFEI